MPGTFTYNPRTPVDSEEEQEPPSPPETEETEETEGLRQWVCTHFGADETVVTDAGDEPDEGVIYQDRWFSERACELVTNECESCLDPIVEEWNYDYRAIMFAVRYGEGDAVVRDSAFSTTYGASVCEDCFHSCDQCGDGYGSYEAASECCYDEEDDEDSGNARGVQRWGYRPRLIFRHQYPGGFVSEADSEDRGGKTPPIYLGLELEVENASHLAAEFLEIVGEDGRDEPRFLFAKTDGSLTSRGIELNLFPSTAEYLRSSHCDSFRTGLDWLADNADMPDTCGMHIHLSRSGFTPHHLWKFLTFHHMNPTLCQTVARRGSVHYAKWHGTDMESVRARLLRHIKRDGGVYQNDRYLAINHQNQQTIELRYFAGAIHSTDVYRNVEWVQSLIEYTRGITVSEMKSGKAGGGDYLLWLSTRTEQYPLLSEFLGGDKGLFVYTPATTTLSA